MNISFIRIVFCVTMVFMSIGCSKTTNSVVELQRFPVDTLAGIITQSGVHIDKEISSDGNGSLKITAAGPTVVRLYQVHLTDIEDSRLVYTAQVRTEGVKGQVYLEMWCHFPDKGEFFSRGLASPLTGTTGWTTEEIPFFLKKGEKPDTVRLNLVINGEGNAWIDDIKLVKSPL
jgi:hypothetical protein